MKGFKHLQWAQEYMNHPTHSVCYKCLEPGVISSVLDDLEGHEFETTHTATEYGFHTTIIARRAPMPQAAMLEQPVSPRRLHKM